MATFTITAVPTNIDTLVGRTGGDTYSINGGALIIDEDARYGPNANTSAIYGAITPSATLGGSVQFDGRYQWLIPFTGGSGTVAAYGTPIGSSTGASGKLSAVHSSLNTAPLTPGSAMPTTGYLRVKAWNGTFYGAGNAFTGITATAAAGEDVGYFIPVGQESTLCLVGSLNQTYGDGSFAKGDWYRVGTTTGNRATAYQIPTNGELVWHGGVWVDKAVATNITAATWAAGVATFTSPAHGLTTDDRVMVDAILPRAWRTVDSQRCTVLNANQFTVPMPVNPGAYVSGGTVAAQEWWPITDSLNTKVGSEDYRGHHCWLDSTTGLLRFGNDNITSTGGSCPTAGRVIRLPNIMSACAPSATKTINSLAANLGTRWRYYNGNAGTIKASHLSGTFSPSVFQTGKAVQMSDCAVVNQVSCSSQAAPSTFTNICVGGNGTTTATQAFVLSSLVAGATLIDCVISTGAMGTRYPLSLATAYGILADRCVFTGTGDRTAGTYSINGNIGSGAVFTRCAFGPHAMGTGSQFSNLSISASSYYAAAYGINPVANSTYTIALTNLSSNWTIDGITPYGSSPLARSGLISAASGSDNPIIRNWGTYTAPLDMRLNGFQAWKPWTRVTTTITVTENGHPYRVGDQVVVTNSTNTTTLTLTVKSITAVTTNTFDFVGVNSGPTSGSVSYYVGNLGAVANYTGVANAKLQNVHVRGNFSAPFATSNTEYGLTLQNVSSDPLAYNLQPSFAANSLIAQSVLTTDYPIISGVSAVFGSHFYDGFVREPGTAVPGQSAPVTGVTWTRTGTTVTVTSPNHGIIGNIQRIWVENSSSPAAVGNNWGISAQTLVVDDKDTFHFTCNNAGAASGTLDYRLSGDSVFRLLMMEPTTATAAQAQITSNAGAAGFTGAGTLVLPAAGDQATWETPGFIQGYDGFAFPPPTLYGTGLTTAASMQLFDIAYQRDDGTGYGPWRNAALWRRNAGGVAGSPVISVDDTIGIQVGDYAYDGTGIATGTKVQARNPGKLTMQGATSAASAPDSAALQLSSSFRIEAKLTLANWGTVTGTPCIVAKGDSASLTKGYYLRFTASGQLTLAVGTGAAAVSATSNLSYSTVFTNGSPGQVAAAWDQAAGKARFYWRLLDTDPWTQLGVDQNLVGAAVGTSASTFFIGQRTTGNDFFTGDIYRVRVYSDATGTTKVFDADWTNNLGTATQTDSVSGTAVVTTTGSQALTLTANNAAAVTGGVVFWNTPNETAFPSTGVRLKVRLTANAANTSAPFQVDFPLLSSSTSRGRLYDQRTQYTLTFTGVVAGSDIRIMTAGTTTSLLDAEGIAGTTYPYTYFYAAGTTVDIQITRAGYEPFRYEGYVLGAANANFLVQQTADRNEGT